MVVSLFLLGCIDDVDVEDPIPLESTVNVEYPIELWDQNVEGISVLRMRVTYEGMVDKISVLESSGYPDFDSSAVRAAKEMRFSPATRDGEDISVWAQIPVEFTKNR